MRKCEHFILTHFNVKFKWSKKGRTSSSQKPPTKEWMEHRIKLFDKYCYPSILGQTNKNFKWLIFFDDETTDKTLFEKYDQCIKIYLKDYDIWNHKLASKEIKKLIHPKTKWIMTTRFDCDDALAKTYVDDIQKKFVPKDMILNPSIGVTYDIYSKVARRFQYLCPNSFLTIVEKLTHNHVKTCHYVNHPLLRNYFKCFTQVRTEYPLWLQIIHDKNLGNVLRGKRIKNPEKLLKDFNIKEL